MKQHDRLGSKPKPATELVTDEGRELTAQERLFVESQNHCALCGSLLQIQVETYLEDYYLREEAECPVCKIKTRVKNHKMH